MFNSGLLFGADAPLLRTPAGVQYWQSRIPAPVTVLAPRPTASAVVTGPTAPIPTTRAPLPGPFRAVDFTAWRKLPGPLPVAVESPGTAPVVVLAPRPKAEAVEDFKFDPSQFGYDPNRKVPEFRPPDGSGTPFPIPDPVSTEPVISKAGLFNFEAMKKPSFWIGSAAFVGMMIFLGTTNNGGSGRPRRRK